MFRVSVSSPLLGGYDEPETLLSEINSDVPWALTPDTWLADVIARISDMPVSRLHELLPWEWSQPVGPSREAA